MRKIETSEIRQAVAATLKDAAPQTDWPKKYIVKIPFHDDDTRPYFNTKPYYFTRRLRSNMSNMEAISDCIRHTIDDCGCPDDATSLSFRIFREPMELDFQ